MIQIYGMFVPDAFVAGQKPVIIEFVWQDSLPRTS